MPPHDVAKLNPTIILIILGKFLMNLYHSTNLYVELSLILNAMYPVTKT